jgi:DNA-binding SARP family transcriptional activator
MASLWVELLGGVRLRLASGAAVTLPTRKSRSLLAYLALATGPQPRARLAELLWSDQADAQARGSLRQELHLLRRVLAGADPPAFHCEGEVVLLDTEAAAVDVLAFERLAGNGDRNALEHAVALYRGDLLAGLTVRAPAFDDRLSFERQRLRGLAIEACGRLLELQMTTAVANDEAVVTARRLLELD